MTARIRDESSVTRIVGTVSIGGTAGQVATVQSDGTLAPATGGSTVLLGSKNLSSADLLALDATKVDLLPALTGRNYYVIHGLVLHYRFVTTPYNENEQNALVVGFGATPTIIASTGFAFVPLAASPGTGDLFKKTADYYVSVPATTVNQALGGYILPASVLEAAALSMAIDPSFVSPLTGGDGTLTVRTFYSVIDGAP